MGDDLASLCSASVADLRALSELLDIRWLRSQQKGELVHNIAKYAKAHKLKRDRRRRVKLVIKYHVAARPYPSLITIRPRARYRIDRIKALIRQDQCWGKHAVIRLTTTNALDYPRDLMDDEVLQDIIDFHPSGTEFSMCPEFSMYSSGSVPAATESNIAVSAATSDDVDVHGLQDGGNDECSDQENHT